MEGEIDTSRLAGACTIDHEGCVVCSDAGIPMQVVSVEDADAWCEDAAGKRMLVAVDLVLPVREGDVLLTHGGGAIGRGAPRAPEVWEGDDEVRQ